MKKVCTFSLVSFAFLFSCVIHAQDNQDWSYDFEDAKKAIGDRHGHMDLVLNGLPWASYALRCNGGPGDYVDGKGSARLYGAKKSMKEPPYLQLKEGKPGGIGLLSFVYRAYADHIATQVPWLVEVSENAGETWRPVGKPFTPTMEVTTFSTKINIPEGLVRIIRADYATLDLAGQNAFKAAFNIDNISITDYVQEDPTKPSLTVEPMELSFGEVIKGEAKGLTLEIGYKNITAPISLTADDAGKELFKISPASVTPAESTGTFSVEVTFEPKALGEFFSSLSITAGDLSASVLLRGKSVRKSGVYEFGGGDGSEASPYLISLPEHLQELSLAVDKDNQSFERKCFLQTADISMASLKNITPIGTNFGPNGQNIRPFSGVYDGGGHKITDLHLAFSGAQYIGVALFGVVKNAQIKRVVLDNSTISADAIVAGIAAALINTNISDCHVGPDVEITATKQFYAGGIAAGSMEIPSIIELCSSSATVRVLGKTGAAGILAVNGVRGTKILRCANMGPIYAKNGQVGGIVGYIEEAPTSISDCSNTGAISGDGDLVAGILGCLSPSVIEPVSISYCYNAATIAGPAKLAPITTEPFIPGQILVLEDNYYSDDAYEPLPNGQVYGIPLSAAEMKTQEFLKKLNLNRDFYPWDFVEGLNNGFPLPFGDGTWMPTAAEQVPETTLPFVVVDGRLIVPEEIRLLFVYDLAGRQCNPEALPEGSTYVVKFIDQNSQSFVQKIVFP